MKKMKGLEYKQLMDADWDAILGVKGAYVDGQEITVDDATEPDNVEDIPDGAKVVVYDGCIMCESKDLDLPFERFIVQWRKLQTHTTLTVQVPNGQVDALKAFIKGLK